MMTNVRLQKMEAALDRLPDLGEIFADDVGYVAYDDDGFAYHGMTRRDVWQEYTDGLHRLMKSTKCSGYTLTELRQHRRMEWFAAETRAAGRECWPDRWHG